MDCKPPGSSVHGISQASILEWVGVSFSRESSQPRYWNWVSCLLHCRPILYWLSYHGIPAESSKSLKDNAVKVLHSICQQIWKTQPWPQDWKRSVLLPTPKNVQTTIKLHSFHMLAKSCSKFSKPGFSNMWTVNSLMFKLVLEKAREPEVKLPTPAGS